MAYVPDRGTLMFTTGSTVIGNDRGGAKVYGLFYPEPSLTGSIIRGNSAQLPSGEVLSTAGGSGGPSPTVAFYKPDFTYATGFTRAVNSPCAASGSRFYVLNGSTIERYTPSGSLEGSVTFSGGADALGVSQDGSFAAVGASNTHTVSLVDLTTGATSVLVTEPTWNITSDPGVILVLQDDSIAVAWVASSTTSYVRRYSRAGALLSDTTLIGTASFVAQMCLGLDAAEFLVGFSRQVTPAPSNSGTVTYYSVSTASGAATSLFVKTWRNSGDGLNDYDNCSMWVWTRPAPKPYVPAGSIVFTNGGNTELKWFNKSGAPIPGPSVWPGSEPSGYDYNIHQHSSGAWWTMSQPSGDPYYFGETWNRNWQHTGGDLDGRYKAGSCIAASAFYCAGNGSGVTKLLLTKHSLTTGEIIQSWDATAMLPLNQGLPDVTAINRCSIAVSPDETIAYWSGKTGVRRWDLVNNVYLGELIPDGSSGDMLGLLVLPDGSFLAGDFKRFAPDGTLLFTYPKPPDLDTAWNQYWYGAARNPAHFNLAYPAASYPDTQPWPYRWAEIDIATGAVLHDFTVPIDWAQFHAEVFVGYGSIPPTPPTSPPPVLVNSDPCCGHTANGSSVSGIVDELPLLPNWVPSCPGFGVVPVAEHITLLEAWDY